MAGRKQEYTKEEVSKALKKIGYLTTIEINQHSDLPSLSTVFNLFKTTKINDVWNELGIPFPSSYTKEEVAKVLKEIGWLRAIGIDPHPDLPSFSTVLRLFKTTSMANVWKELSIISQNPSYTKKEVSKALKETGWLPKKEVNKHPDLPVHTTILKLFKTTKLSDVWNELNIEMPQRKK